MKATMKDWIGQTEEVTDELGSTDCYDPCYGSEQIAESLP